MPGAYNPDQSSQQAQDDDNYIHYGRIPQRVPRRFKTTKKIQSVSHLKLSVLVPGLGPAPSMFPLPGIFSCFLIFRNFANFSSPGPPPSDACFDGMGLIRVI